MRMRVALLVSGVDLGRDFGWVSGKACGLSGFVIFVSLIGVGNNTFHSLAARTTFGYVSVEVCALEVYNLLFSLLI